jgi:hypothetical protein
MNRKISAILLVALAAGAGLALSYRLFNTNPATAQLPKLETVTVVDTPRTLQPFSLDGAKGQISADNL